MGARNLIFYTTATQYDGTNSAEILALFPATQGSEGSDYPKRIVSEIDGVLLIDYTSGYLLAGSPWQFDPISEGDWIVPNAQYPGVIPALLPGAVVAATAIDAAELINP